MAQLLRRRTLIAAVPPAGKMPLGAIWALLQLPLTGPRKVLGFSCPSGVASLRSEGAVTEQRVQRRLAAILAADVVGYSALMQRAEEATYAAFERLKRELIEPSLSRHDGRLIKTTGDGALAEFASPLAAVGCAVEIQDSIASGRSSSSCASGSISVTLSLERTAIFLATGSTLLSGWKGSPIRAAS